jgi:cation transport ATPase
MEPQHIYRQRETSNEEILYHENHQKEKISMQEESKSSILNIVFHCIIMFLSVMFYMISTARRVPAVIVSMILINLFFFVLAWFSRKRIKRRRKNLYSCLIFVSTLALLFSSLMVIDADSSNIGGLLILWSGAILLDIAIYCFLRFSPLLTL